MLAVCRGIGEDHAVVHHLAVPLSVGKAQGAAMEVVLAGGSVQVQLIGLIIDAKTAVGDTIGTASGHLAHAGAIAEVVFRLGIAQDDIRHTAIPVGGHEADNTRSYLAQLHAQAMLVRYREQPHINSLRILTPDFCFNMH